MVTAGGAGCAPWVSPWRCLDARCCMRARQCRDSSRRPRRHVRRSPASLHGTDQVSTASGPPLERSTIRRILTAACTTLPLGTLALVTNLQNGRSVQVRINDRGPFVRGARSTFPITLPPRLESWVRGPPGCGSIRAPGPAPGAGLLRASWLVFGFHQCPAFGNRLSQYFPDVRIDRLSVGGRPYYRVRMGAFPDHATALDAPADRAARTAIDSRAAMTGESKRGLIKRVVFGQPR